MEEVETIRLRNGGVGIFTRTATAAVEPGLSVAPVALPARNATGRRAHA